MKNIAVAIDGPSASGKSSTSKAIAKKLNFIYVDTGALYRGIGYYCIINNVDTKNAILVNDALNKIDIKLDYDNNNQQIIILNNEDVTSKIRTPEVSMAASNVSAIPKVRDFLLNLQRNIANKNNVIMDGRDIGTVILPNAKVKIFLIANNDARAKRRYLEYKEKNIEVDIETIKQELIERDKQDSERAVAPLKPANDAIIIDNSDLSYEETINKIIEIIKAKSNE